MRYLSVCSGIEAATVAWEPLGFKPIAFSEIEPFPKAILQYHFSHVPIHGDFTTIGKHDYGTADIIVGGTPCQDYSVAGQRAGMAGARGNLTLEFVRLLERVRPRWVVWENVPGVLSSNRGRDFGAFLGALAEIGYGWAYRILDAQYFGVPQRRRRVFVVGHLGDERRAAAVLFERKSLCRNPPPQRQAGSEPSLCVTSRFGSGRNDPTMETYVTGTLMSQVTEELFPVATPYHVRRLTPRECERLQGFPDDYTLISFRGKPVTDGHRYRAIGNSMAVPVMRWIGQRIQHVEEILNFD